MNEYCHNIGLRRCKAAGTIKLIKTNLDLYPDSSVFMNLIAGLCCFWQQLVVQLSPKASSGPHMWPQWVLSECPVITCYIGPFSVAFDV